jgi:CRP/FNR family cyclic AMP-dependent transcriptional regulator
VPCDASSLADIPLFARLAPGTRQALAEATTVRHYRRNMFVFAEGEPAESLHVVLEGRVRVFRDTPGGHEQTLQVLERGGLLAVVCFVEGRPYPASAQTVTDSRIASIRNPDLARLAQEHGDLAWALLQQLARRLLWAQGRIYDLALRSATGRVVSALLQFARAQGREDERGRLTVDLPLTHRELGQLTGVSRETVTRTLGQLRDAGALRWTSDGLLVLEVERLEEWLRV